MGWEDVARFGPPPRRSGGSKPPKKRGKLCVQIAPFAAWPALLALGGAIWQSLT